MNSRFSELERFFIDNGILAEYFANQAEEKKQAETLEAEIYLRWQKLGVKRRESNRHQAQGHG